MLAIKGGQKSGWIEEDRERGESRKKEEEEEGGKEAKRQRKEKKRVEGDRT